MTVFRRIIFLSLLVYGWFPSASLFALDLPDVPTRYVNDYVSLLSPSIRQSLESQLRQFEEQTSNQVLVAIFPNLQGETIEEFSIRLAEKWKPGQKGRDNGVILVVAKEERAVRIEVAYGLEGVLTDATSRSILEDEILPRFKQGDFDGGITAGIQAIFKATRGEYQALPRQQAGRVPLLLVIFLVILFFIILSSLRRSGGYGLGSRGPRGGWGGGGGWGGSGGGGFGGGGFSSGGGSFGGGGASGRW